MKTKRVVNWLISKNAIPEEDRELYEYACNSFLYILFPIVLALIVGIITKKIAESMVFIVPFITLRNFCGGYHMRTAKQCIFTSTVLFCVFFSLGRINVNQWIYYLVNIVSAISIAVISPVVSDNKKINDSKIKKAKRTAIFIILFYLIISYVLFLTKRGSIARYLILGQALTAILQWPCVVKKTNHQHN